jgi:hypothetical protein
MCRVIREITVFGGCKRDEGIPKEPGVGVHG